MHTHQYSFRKDEPSWLSRVIVETLKNTKTTSLVDISAVAQCTRLNASSVKEALRRVMDLGDDSLIRLDGSNRIKLALEACRLGSYLEVVRALTWQEFEEFSEECINRASFETTRGLLFKDGTKRWQIDLVARKGALVLAVDCKHWKARSHPSKFKLAVQHHKRSLKPLLRYMKSNGQLTEQEVWALPLILTLFEPRTSLVDGVVVLSIGQLSDLLDHLSPYDPNLPLTSFALAESPIS